MEVVKENELSDPIAYEQYQKIHEQRMKLRGINFNSESSTKGESRQKISQIKTIQKFIGKFKAENKNHQAILAEVDTLNLSKYLEQISNIIANSVSQKDVSFYSEIATRLNQEYDNFPSMIIKDLTKTFNNGYEAPQDNKSKMKTVLLFTTELFICGFAFSYKEIKQMLIKMVKAGNKKRNNFTTEKELKLFAFFYNCDTYSSFLLHYATIFTQNVPLWISKWRKQGHQVAKYPQTIPIKMKEQITSFFSKYVANCLLVLQAALEKIQQLETQLRENLRMTGEFNKQIELNYNQLIEKFLFTKKHVELILAATGSDAIIENYEAKIIPVDDIMRKYINKIDNIQIFQNEFERELYEEVPDLVKTEEKTNTDDKYKKFKEKLDSCKNKNDADEIAKSFEEINNKKTRKSLAKDILEYRKQYQLVTPFLCRVAAVVYVSWKDIGETINEQLMTEYQKLKQNSNSTFVINDKRSRNLKYICEFAKFRIIDCEKAIGCIQNLIDDLKGQNIQLLIACLESVGRFLYLSPNSANKFTFSLSKLENVMKQKSFPLFTTSQLMNSISLLKPHIELPKAQEIEKTKMETKAETVLSKDIISDLDSMIHGIIQIIENKQGEGLSAIKLNLIKQIENYDFLGNYNYAYMLTELKIPQITAYATQKTLQRLNDSIKSFNFQNSILWSRFLGQLFKYQLVKKSFLYQTLDGLLQLEGVDIGVINAVCTILQTCDQYLDSRKISSKNQKFMFLVSFKKFIHKCLYVPMLEEFKIIDVFDNLEPNLTSIKMEILNNFLEENGINQKSNGESKKDVDLTKALDIFLERKNLKQIKKVPEVQGQDPRNKQSLLKEDEGSQTNCEQVMAESKQFDTEFNYVMNSNMKDYSGRIAKPTHVEKIIERKKDKKRAGESQKRIVVIGRSGNRFVKKDVIYKCDGKNQNCNSEKIETKSEELIEEKSEEVIDQKTEEKFQEKEEIKVNGQEEQ